MKIYNPLEIAIIFGGCKTEAEVYRACEALRYLVLQAGQKHLYLMTRLSIKRIHYLISQQ